MQKEGNISKVKRYRVQYADKERFAEWSEWRNIDEPPKESDILSIYIEEEITIEEYNKFMENFEIGNIK